MKPTLAQIVHCFSIQLLVATGSWVSVGPAAQAAAPTVPVLDNLQLWLQADAGVTTNDSGGVIAWEDQSGMGNNAFQTDDTMTPLLVNGELINKPVLRFDGVNDYLAVATAPSIEIIGDISSFAVVRFDDFANYREVWGKTVNNLPGPTDYYLIQGTGVPQVYRGNGTIASLGAVPANRAVRAGAYLILAFDMAGTTLTHYVNGYPIGSGQITATVADGGTALMIGTRADFFTKMKGDIAEVLIYDAALSEPDRNTVFEYLKAKYNLQNLPPTVSLSSPADNATFKAPTNIVVTVQASDSDGTIARVDFYVNGNRIVTATAKPYTVPIAVKTAGTLVLTAVATDDRDGIATSTAITVNVTAGETAAYTPGSNLKLWLKADAGVTANADGWINAWADQSGEVNDALQADESMAPQLVEGAVNGQPVVRFDGARRYLSAPTTESLIMTGDIASFFVVKFDDFAPYQAVWSKTAGNLPRPTDYYALPGSGTPRFYRGGFGQNQYADGAAVPAGQYMVAGFSQAGTAVTHFLNGNPTGGGNITIPAEDAGTDLMVGSRADFVTQMKGDIAELLIFNTAVEGSDQAAVSEYLAAKYGIPVFLSANQPPAVSLTEPLAGSRFQAPTNISIKASATDADGSLVSLDLYINGQRASTSTNGTLAATWAVTNADQFTCTAVATDNLGAQSQSAPVSFCTRGVPAIAGLIGYWPLDGDGKSVVNVEGNPVNDPIPTEDRNGQPDGAMLFDNALRQYIEIPGGGGLNGLARGTISLWAKWTGPQYAGFDNSYGAVLGRQNNLLWSDDIINLSSSDPDAAVVIWRQAVATPATITGTSIVGNDTWRHIAVTFAPAGSELFVDGVSQGTGASPVLHASSDVPLGIGAWIGDGNAYATAAIDDVAIWDRPLSAEQIQALAAQVKTPLDVEMTQGCQEPLAIRLEAREAVITWDGPGVLESALLLSGPWNEVPNASSPFRAPAQGTQFYRLRLP